VYVTRFLFPIVRLTNSLCQVNDVIVSCQIYDASFVFVARRVHKGIITRVIIGKPK